MRLMIEILAALLLVICIGASSAAFAAGGSGSLIFSSEAHPSAK